MFRNYLGVDVTAGELKAVRLARKGRKTVLLGGRVMSLPDGVLQVSARESNIRELPRFLDALREVLAPLAGREDRVALSLPDTAGRLLLTEVDNSFKTRAEGIDILKWQLKGSLPADAPAVRLDYQVLETKESGRLRLAVAVMAEKVLFPYEEALDAAGFQTAVIDFHSLSLYNFYRPRLDLGENFVLVGIGKNQLSLQHFHGRTLAFHRARQVAPVAGSIFQELNRSLVAGQEVSPALPRATVFVHSDLEESEVPVEAVRSAFARDVLPLDPHLDRLAPGGAGDVLRAEPGLAAAVGVAERMM